ncbi:MAG: DUF1080 domain-containing protein [Pirellulaceae bacterium]
MPRALSLAFVFAFLCCAVAASQELSPEEQAEGFVSLFNGKDFSGWQFGGGYALPEAPENWKVEDDVIRLSGGGRPNLGTQWDYEDFEMRFQWRAMREKYNSGFFIRSNRKVGNNQINLAKGGEGRFFGGKMNGGQAVPQLQKPAGEWNEWRVRIVGDKVAFWCNGEQAWEGTEFASPRGHLGLQAEGAPLEFRNLRIREIGAERLDALAKWNSPGGHWKQQGDALVSDGEQQPLVTLKDDYGDFLLRLEWRDEKSAGGKLTLLGSDGRESFDLALDREVVNPGGQWNYLEVRRTGDEAAVWLNGKTIKGQLATGPTALTITDAGTPLELRNVRIAPRSE